MCFFIFTFAFCENYICFLHKLYVVFVGIICAFLFLHLLSVRIIFAFCVNYMCFLWELYVLFHFYICFL